MFLDPEPKGKESSSRPNSPFHLAQPFFASQSSLASPRQQNFRIKRTSGENLSSSLKSKDLRRSTSSVGANSINSTGEDGKPTVRLVNDSAISTPLSENVWPRNPDWTAGNNAPPHSPMLASYQPASASKTGSPATSRVSDIKAQLAKSSKLDLPPIVTLPPSVQSRIASDPSRRSTSSKYSASGISLYDTDADVNSSFTGSDTSRPGRQSNRSTLNEEEILAAVDDKEGFEPSRTKAPALETVVETPSERSTAPSVSSSYIINDKHTARKVRSSSPDRSPKSSSPALPWEQQRRTQYPSQDSFGSSLPASSLSLPHSPTRPLTGQVSAETLAYDRHDSQTSSPNFIAFSSSSGHRSSDTPPLHHAASSDSVQANLGTPSVFRPITSGTTEVENSPIYSPPIHHYRSTSADLTSPVSSPRRQHEQVPSTPRSYSMDASQDMDYEDIDLEPWPRNQFSSHLSTIASVSDRAMSPSHFSHFSVGSGVYTIDDALSMSRNSGTLSTFSFGRRASEPLQSPTRKPSPQHTQHTQSSEEEPGDMTLGVYRAESAKPEPLFRGRQVTSEGDVRYDGPLPPLPPMPRSRHGNASDETSDRLSALSAPSLKKQRSGYSMRGRSNSTPSGGNTRQNSIVSYCESERSSRGSSNLFPIWARNYYGGYAALLSASKISLHNPPTPRRENFQQQFKGHVRSASQWTQGSITSRLGTGYSEIENVSPTSSHFLPAIFRPRTRTLGNPDTDSRSFKFGSKSSKTKSRVSQPSADDQSRSDSMVITSVPQETAQSGDTLPSGHPRFGTLKDNSQNQPPMPPLPRKYSKQKLWDEMTFPRPMTKDRLSDFHLNPDEDPHLSPSKNQRSEINKFRSPSFVESFDTLFNSRGNRQILLFALGFLCPLFWLLGALLPLPPRHSRDASEAEKALPNANADSEDDLTATLNKHRSGDARVKWDEERVFLKAKWWRTLNRVMCFVGVAIIAAVVSCQEE
jgi:hypothetical protein